ncbi:hypothetical protein [Hansschlegelia sp. KR7-227]|uniref:hypothetical protein n=1 Tax=Hansschlegelia sp. KR7-227 TaxID=3400914 RepID=UPI003C0C97BE
MRSCLLHIGTPKTGSTTIQGFLASCLAALAARGVDVPDLGYPDIVRAHRKLADGLRGETDPAQPATEPWIALDRRLAETEGDLCLSRETICQHLAAPPRLAFVRGFFARRGMRLHVVSYVRDHPSFLSALYAQHAKNMRMTEEFDAWLERILSDPPARLSYRLMFRNLLAANDLRFTLRPLEAVGGDALVADFCELLGRPDIDRSGFDPKPFRNATPGPKAIAAGVLGARTLAARGVEAYGDPRFAQALEAVAAERGWSERPFFGPDETAAARIERRFAAGDDEVARLAWGGRWSDHVSRAPRTRHAMTIADVPKRDRDEIEDAARDAVDRVLGRSLLQRLGLGRRGGA